MEGGHRLSLQTFNRVIEMNEMILLKLGEMVLKGLNRRSFEDKLQAVLKPALAQKWGKLPKGILQLLLPGQLHLRQLPTRYVPLQGIPAWGSPVS